MISGAKFLEAILGSPFNLLLLWVLEHGDFEGRPLHTPFDLSNYTVVITVNLITISDDAQTGAKHTPSNFLVPFFGNRKHR